MSMQDPIGDMITCIRNSHFANKLFLYTDYSFFKIAILKVLFNEGYIDKYEIITFSAFKKNILIYLKYFLNKPVITEIVRVSRPGLRIYKSFDKIPRIISGLGIVVISTSKGVMSGHEAFCKKIGGEIICYVK